MLFPKTFATLTYLFVIHITNSSFAIRQFSMSANAKVSAAKLPLCPRQHQVYNNPKKPHAFEMTNCIIPCQVPVFDRTLKLSTMAEGSVSKKVRGGNRVVEVDKLGKCAKYANDLLQKPCDDISCKNVTCNLDCSILCLTPSIVKAYRQMYVDIEKAAKNHKPDATNRFLLGMMYNSSSSKEKKTISMLRGQRRKRSRENSSEIDGTTCSTCIWCRSDEKYYLDPPHRFLEIDADGEQKCRGYDAAQKYMVEHSSKNSMIALPAIEGAETCKSLNVHPEVFRKLFSLGNERYTKLNKFRQTRLSLHLYRDKRFVEIKPAPATYSSNIFILLKTVFLCLCLQPLI